MAVKALFNKRFINGIKKDIAKDDSSSISGTITKLHPADIAELFRRVNVDESKYIYKLLNEETAADVLVELDENIKEELLSHLSPREIAEQVVDHIASDDAADIIGELPEHVQSEIISHIEDPEQAKNISDLLAYEEDTAGALVTKELIKVQPEWNVLKCVREMRKQAQNVDSVYAIYVVDSEGKFLGLLSLKKLLIAPAETLVGDLFKRDVISVKISTKTVEVADIMQKYNFAAMPVVDENNILVGRITIDDIVDVIREEDTEDVQKMGGMAALKDPYINTSVFQLIKKRTGWLVILFIGESLTATAMGFFENQIAKAVVLALFVPLIISSGGNTGSQASTLIIRALALGEVTIGEWWKIFLKEIRVGISLGLVLGIIGFLRVALWSQFVGVLGEHWVMVGCTVSVALFGVVLWGNLVGSLFPIVLQKVGFDPAVSSAPFVATFVDITGLVIYFTAASLFLTGIIL